MHFTRRGFDPRQPAAFIAEGLLPYLNPEQQRGLLSQVDVLSARGSAVAADRIVGDPHASGRVASLSRRSGVDMTRLIASGENNEIESVLVDRGWNMRETSVAEVATFYGRDLTDPFGETQDESAPEPPWLETRFLQGTRSNLSLRLEVRAVVPMLSSMIPGEIVEYLDTGKVLAAFRVRARELTQKRRASPDVLRDLCGT